MVRIACRYILLMIMNRDRGMVPCYDICPVRTPCMLLKVGRSLVRIKLISTWHGTLHVVIINGGLRRKLLVCLRRWNGLVSPYKVIVSRKLRIRDRRLRRLLVLLMGRTLVRL